MTDSKFLPGALVRDNHARVGRVVGDPMLVELDGNTVEVFAVNFWGQELKRPDNWLTPLPPGSPEALLLDRPSALASWTEEAPLKLVALALSSGGGEGKMADIRAKLDGRVLETGKWENWWKKQQQQMRKLPTCFKIVKTGRDSKYNLLTWYDSVPAASELKSDFKSAGTADKGAPATDDWRKWLESSTHEPPPGRFPTRQVATNLAKWPAKTVEQALLRVIVSAEEALSSDSPSPQVAEGWLRSVAQASLRWRETAGPDTGGYTAARVGGVLARLARIAGDRTPQELLLRAGVMDGDADAWRRGFAAGMWEAFDGDDAREMYRRSAAVLGRQARGDLAREIVLAAFGPEFSESRHSALDRLLDALPEGERTRLLQEVIARASIDQRNDVLGYIAKSRHSSDSENFGLRLVATLSLTDERSELAARTSRELADALERPEIFGRRVEIVFSATVDRASATKANVQRQIKELRVAHEAALEQERQEQERLRQQVRDLDAELAAKRELSRLEIRRDMLLAIGEVLQSVLRRSNLEEVVGDVEAGLGLALRAGGAELINTAPEGYDPRLHQSSEKIVESSQVKVLIPGVIVRGRTHGDLVLLKAQVEHEAI